MSLSFGLLLCFCLLLVLGSRLFLLLSCLVLSCPIRPSFTLTPPSLSVFVFPFALGVCSCLAPCPGISHHLVIRASDVVWEAVRSGVKSESDKSVA
jgi:hypothetical protein